MANMLKQIDVWIVASHTEGLGRLGLEAMSAGCALITSNTGVEYAKHEENCLITKIGDVDSLAHGLDRMLTDDKLRKEIVAAGQKTSYTYADDATFTKAWLKIIEELF